MSTPSSLPINLPPRFANSFWSSPEYRAGVESLYARLQSGLDEDKSILALVEHRAALEYSHAEQLATPSPLPSYSAPLFKNALREGSSKGARSFASSESSASHAFRRIEAEAIKSQAGAHARVARTLERNVLIPFGKWSDEHKDKVQNSWEFLDANLQRFERQKAEVRGGIFVGRCHSCVCSHLSSLQVERLRSQYESKCRQADEAEDDARFAGGEMASPAFVSSDSETLMGAHQQNIPQDSLPPSAHTLSTDESVPSGEKSQQDPDRLKRRETLREQFGFRRASSRGQEDDDKYTPLSPRSVSAEISGSQKFDEGGLKRSNTLSNALSSAISKASEVPAFQNLRAAVGVLNEPRHLRLRKEAEGFESQYKEAVQLLDRLRCDLEEVLVDHFNLAERWEASRLVAVKRVLAAFNAAFLPLLPTLSSSLQRSAALEPVLDPDQSLSHLIVDARTGPYQPQPQVFHPYYHDDPGSLAGAGTAGFGMELAAFMRAETLASESGQVSGEIRAGAGSGHKIGMPAIPLALMALLASLERMYDDPSRWPIVKDQQGEEERSLELAVNEEKRKSWIYEVPLANSHRCRKAIISHLLGNSVPGADVGAGLETKLKRFDAPTLAATVKLWAMELTDSLVSRELWDLVDNTYRAAAGQEYDARSSAAKLTGDAVNEEERAEGGATEGKGKARAEGLDPVLEETIRKGVLADLGVVLSKLPKIHLVCLDAIVAHLARLVKATPTNEADSEYLNKVALSLGRVLIRPPVETTSTLRSKAPILLAHDLVKFYDELLPALLERKAKESEAALFAQRRTPIRKRTKPVDQRMSRSRMAADFAGAPALPAKERAGQRESEWSSPSPKVVTSMAGEKEEEDATPTPIASRILGSSNSTLAVDEAEASRVKSPSSVSGASSSYDTPDDEADAAVEGKDAAGNDQTSTTRADAESTDKSSSPSKASLHEEDRPLSNVARLSRQFGSNSSAKSMVRGPRAANASGATPTRQSKDSAPLGDEN